MSQQLAIHQSIKRFLEAKSMITTAQAEAPGFPPAVELAYKHYAKHRVGVANPVLVPTNLMQVPAKILDDADWKFLEDLVDIDPELEAEVLGDPVGAPEPVSGPGPAPATEPEPKATDLVDPKHNDALAEAIGKEESSGSDEGADEDQEESDGESETGEGEGEGDADTDADTDKA